MADDAPWPLPKHNPGPTDHLHAIGVISVTFANFQASVEGLYQTAAAERNIPRPLIHFFYQSLNEEKRIIAIRTIFTECETDPSVTSAVENLLEFFNWSRHCRNNILHAERYPPSIGANPDLLHLVKRGAKSSGFSYMKFSVERLRLKADKIREGVVQSAEIQLYLRF